MERKNFWPSNQFLIIRMVKIKLNLKKKINPPSCDLAAVAVGQKIYENYLLNGLPCDWLCFLVGFAAVLGV